MKGEGVVSGRRKKFTLTRRNELEGEQKRKSWFRKQQTQTPFNMPFCIPPPPHHQVPLFSDSLSLIVIVVVICATRAGNENNQNHNKEN